VYFDEHHLNEFGAIEHARLSNEKIREVMRSD